jgi:hypothetical protein
MASGLLNENNDEMSIIVLPSLLHITYPSNSFNDF